jgi:hypothetical protein
MRSLGAVSVLVLAAAAAPAGADTSLTCDPEEINPRSYRLTTRAMAEVVNEERTDWWRNWDLLRVQDDLADLNDGTARAAARALEIDPRNQMAHAVLARYHLLALDGEAATAEWATVLDAGGAVAWTGTLYDVDARTYFLLAFDLRGIRIYRFDQVVERVDRRFYGIPEFPGAHDERFWAASGGCIDPAIRPEAFVPWSSVREIKAGNWVLWFKLTAPVRVSSDRSGKAKTLDEIKVNLHGAAGDWEVYKPVGEDNFATRARGPAGFQDLVRRTLVGFVDPERRIALPPLKPGVGW